MDSLKLVSCFFCVLLINKKQLWRGPFNEHSYQVWFQLTPWYQRRRLKCKSLRMTMLSTDAKWWQYFTWPFGSGELKTYSYILNYGLGEGKQIYLEYDLVISRTYVVDFFQYVKWVTMRGDCSFLLILMELLTIPP